MVGQEVVDLAELRQSLFRSLVSHEASRGVEDLKTAPQRREPQQQLVLGGTQGRVLEQGLKSDEVPRSERCADRGLDVLRQPDRIHDSVEELGVADVDLVAAYARRLHALGGKRDHLGVGDRPRRSDQLRADLVGLAPVLKAAFLGGDDGPRVAEPKRQSGRSQLACDQPRDGDSPFTDQRDDIAAAVCELEEAAPLLDAKTEVEHVHRLHERGDDVAVAPTSHLGEKRFLRFAQDLGLER